MGAGDPTTRFTAPFEDGIFSAHGRLAQRESAAFTRQRSLVRNQHRPLQKRRFAGKTLTIGASDGALPNPCAATQWDSRELDPPGGRQTAAFRKGTSNGRLLPRGPGKDQHFFEVHPSKVKHSAS